jgi:hypothetical protein
MISNKELFLRSYKKQQNLNPDIFLPPSENFLKRIPLTKVKIYKPRKVTVNTRYGEVSIKN